jgi:ATP/maltotriose-dependent transcriptional regulator MalT
VAAQDPEDVHVDRERELEIFNRMIAGTNARHIFVITAPSGMGKTQLVREFRRICSEKPGARVGMVRLDAGVEDPIDVLGRLATRFGIDDFLTFTAANLELARGAAPSLRSEKAQLQHVTQAFIADLARLADSSEGPTLLIFDAFNDRSRVVEAWLENHLLSAVAHRRSINVVVAGQTSPQLLDDEVTEQSEVGMLGPENVREWAERLELRLSEERIQTLYLASGEGFPRLLRDMLYNTVKAKARGG